jgi:stress-induced-phosphoprotein 1
LQKGDAHNALEDASACIGLNPQFAKGYSRKGAALHALKRYNDSITSYQEGLTNFPTDAGLKKGLADVEREKENPYGIRTGSSATPPAGGVPLGGLFSPAMLAQLGRDPKMSTYLEDPEVMQKIELVQKNPNLLPTILNDPKMMEMLGLMMGDMEGAADDSPASAPAPAQKKKESENQPMEVEEDLSHLSVEEQKKKETDKAAKQKKEEGNTLYQKKEFEKALAAYDEAIAIDPTNMTFVSNKAAVYFTQKKYDECIEECEKALEVGKANMAPFEDRGKALTRCAKAYQKKGNLEKGIELCKSAQLENFNKDTQRLLKTWELEKKKRDVSAYHDDEKAEEAKKRGNDFFREKKWPEAVKEYEDAVKRAPKNAAIRNNLSAALCKIMDFNGAKREIEKAIELDPKYVKAWARKGDVEMVMKEFHKARDSYNKGLEIEPGNSTCKQGLQKCTQQIAYGRQNMTEDEKKEQTAHAMADPEIQSILTDPLVQQVLKDFGENPAAAQKAMLDPSMRGKIEKLIASGVVETR